MSNFSFTVLISHKGVLASFFYFRAVSQLQRNRDQYSVKKHSCSFVSWLARMTRMIILQKLEVLGDILKDRKVFYQSVRTGTVWFIALFLQRLHTSTFYTLFLLSTLKDLINEEHIIFIFSNFVNKYQRHFFHLDCAPNLQTHLVFSFLSKSKSDFPQSIGCITCRAIAHSIAVGPDYSHFKFHPQPRRQFDKYRTHLTVSVLASPALAALIADRGSRAPRLWARNRMEIAKTETCIPLVYFRALWWTTAKEGFLTYCHCSDAENIREPRCNISAYKVRLD